MAVTNAWNNDRTRTRVLVQDGGPGNPWVIVDTDVDAELSAPSGGGQSVERTWGRGPDGANEYKGVRITSDPNPVTFDLMKRLSLKPSQFLNDIYRNNCGGTYRADLYCDDPLDAAAFQATIWWIDSWPVGQTYSANIVNGMQTTGDDIARTLNIDAAFEAAFLKVFHRDLTKSAVDATINQIISAGVRRCFGDCGDQQTGEEEFWGVTAADSTPGYGGNPTGSFIWTEDGGNTWSQDYIPQYDNQPANGLVKVGNYVFVVSSGAAPVYASIDDVKADRIDAWTTAPGISANFPSSIAVTPNGTVWAAGAGGYVYRKLPGTFTFEEFDAAATTTEDINDIAVANDDRVFFVGDNGTLLLYENGSISSVTVQDSSGTAVTANLNTVATPRLRERQVYIGTADGKIWRTDNIIATSPVFEEKTFIKSGTGSIDDLQFIGWKGTMLYIIQTNGDGESRVLRDLSGGNLGLDVEIVGDFDSPIANDGFNTIAPANEMFALVGGNILTAGAGSGQAFIGKVSA